MSEMSDEFFQLGIGFFGFIISAGIRVMSVIVLEAFIFFDIF
jgi:hypothetical protein